MQRVVEVPVPVYKDVEVEVPYEKIVTVETPVEKTVYKDVQVFMRVLNMQSTIACHDRTHRSDARDEHVHCQSSIIPLTAVLRFLTFSSQRARAYIYVHPYEPTMQVPIHMNNERVVVKQVPVPVYVNKQVPVNSLIKISMISIPTGQDVVCWNFEHENKS